MTPRDDPLFELVAFLLASARDVVDTTAAYGGFRLLDATSRTIAARDRMPELPTDPFLTELRDHIEARTHELMKDEQAFVAVLDELLSRVAAEVKRRNLAEDPT